MDAPATPPPKCPFRPGDLRVVPAPRWGVARVAKAGGGSIDLMDCHQADADAAAHMLAGHAALLAERDRLLAALHRLAEYPADDLVRLVARQAIGLEVSPC